MARRKVHNVAAIVKAYEAEAKRAERNAKAFRGDSIEDTWLSYAAKCRHQAVEASKQPAEVVAEPDPLPVAVSSARCAAFDHLPQGQADYARELMRREAIDAARFAANRAEGVRL
jgi:LAS superfamily LD-carboxypeptidase LdcB